MLTVTVTPVDTGWAVRSHAIDNDLVFHSGAKAEAAAKRLAQALAETGESVEIAIHLRGGDRAGRFVCTSSLPSGAVWKEPRRTAAGEPASGS